MSEPLKPIFYYSVLSGNIGDRAIRKSIVEAIKERIDVPFAFFNTQNAELTIERIIKQLNVEGSALMIAGGGLYCNIKKSSGWYFPCSPDLFELIKIPIILFGIGYNSHLKGTQFREGFDEFTANSIAKINKYAKISTVRDQRTYDTLAEFGVTNHELMLDPACFLKYKEQKKIKRVAIQLAQHSPILGRYDGTQEYREKNIKAYAEICEYLHWKGYEVIFIAFDPLEQSIIFDLKKLFPHLLFMNTDNIDTILEEYSRCAFSIGCKMHSNILSFATKTPFISLYYDKKSPEFLKMINWEPLGFPIFDLNVKHVKQGIEYIENNYRYLRSQLWYWLETDRPKFNKAIDRICEVIING